MELKLILTLVRRWFWLLVVGGILGGAAGYLISNYQDPVYQSTTKVMLIGVSQEQLADPSRRISTDELIQTYAQLLLTTPVLEKASQRLGYVVHAQQIQVRQTPQTRFFQVTVSGSDPQRVAESANTLVETLTEYNDELQTERFEQSTSSLQNQLNDISARIEEIEQEIIQSNETNIQTQKTDIENQIALLQTEIQNAQREILNINAQATIPEGGTTPVLTVDQQAELESRQLRLEQMQSQLVSYQNAYFNLTVLRQAVPESPAESLAMQQLQEELVLYQGLYGELLTQYETTRIASLNETPNVVLVDLAKVPTIAIRPLPVRDGLIATVIGILLASVIAFFIEYLDDTLKSNEAVTRLLQLPVIGNVAYVRGLANEKPLYAASQPRSAFSESLRTLRTNLDFAKVDKPLRTLLVTSSNPSDGKTTLAANLAAIMAQSGQKVVLVDGDLRKASVHKFFGGTNSNGLTNVLARQVSLDDALQSFPDKGISVLSSGPLPPNPTELLRSEIMGRTLQMLVEKFDMVIVDGPPCVVADASVLASKVDGVLMVVSYSKTREGLALGAVEQLRRAKACLVGVVVNSVREGGRNDYYYNSYYGYHSDPAEEKRRGWLRLSRRPKASV